MLSTTGSLSIDLNNFKGVQVLIISSQFAIILFHSSMVLGKKEVLWTDVLHDTGVRDRLLTCSIRSAISALTLSETSTQSVYIYRAAGT